MSVRINEGAIKNLREEVISKTNCLTSEDEYLLYKIEYNIRLYFSYKNTNDWESVHEISNIIGGLFNEIYREHGLSFNLEQFVTFIKI